MQWWQHLNTLKANLLTLGPRKLTALAVLAAVTTLAVSGIGYYSSRSKTEALYIGLSSSDVARMGTALQAAGIPFDVSADGSKILVRRVQAAPARMLLAEKGLPSGSTSGYELFDKLGPLGLTSFMQEVTRTRALEGELARTIQTMKGVKSARVHIVYPESNSFRRNRQPPSASVVVRMEGLREASAAVVIRHLVAAAVPGLSPELVSVMSTDGAVLAASSDASGYGSAKLIELERSVSGQLQDSIRRTLAPYLGIEHFAISVTARMNFDKRQQNEQIFDPEAKSERSTRVVRETGSAQNAGARQGATVEQNVPGEAPTGAAEQSRKNNERREELTNYEINSKAIVVTSEGHRIDSVNVAVVLNRKRLVASLDGNKDPKALEQRIKEIENLVSAAIGLNASRGDKINIAAFDFAEVPSDGSGKLTLVESLMLHLDRAIVSLTALAAIAMVIWFGLLPAVRTIASQSSPSKRIEALASASIPGVEGPFDVKRLPAESTAAGESAKTTVDSAQKKLAEMIERDEKQFALILKQWMAKA